MRSFEAILPLKIDAREGASELDRFSTLLLPSLDCFFVSNDNLKISLIVPAGDILAVSERLQKLKRTDIRVFCEDDLCPNLKGQSGWYKQQILKLAAANLVSSEYYLVLDSDVILKRPTEPQDLFPSGKPILQKLKASTHWDSWMGSREILKSAVDLAPDSEVMDVTPEFLHREVCLALQNAIATRNNSAEWDKFLMESSETGWTEYTLYWLFVLERGLDRQLYDWSPLQMYEGIFHLCEADRLSRSHLQRIFAANSDSFFLVVQSNINLELPYIQRRIQPYLREQKNSRSYRNRNWFGKMSNYFSRGKVSDTDEVGSTIVSSVQLYEDSVLQECCRQFRELLDTSPAEDEVRAFLKTHELFFSAFHPRKFMWRPAAPEEYRADFALLNESNELLLIAVASPGLPLLTGDGPITAELEHAFGQVQGWHREFDNHRAAALAVWDLQTEEVARLRGIIIAGRTWANETGERRLGSEKRGDVEFYTYDDLLKSVAALIRQPAGT